MAAWSMNGDYFHVEKHLILPLLLLASLLHSFEFRLFPLPSHCFHTFASFLTISSDSGTNSSDHFLIIFITNFITYHIQIYYHFLNLITPMAKKNYSAFFNFKVFFFIWVCNLFIFFSFFSKVFWLLFQSFLLYLIILIGNALCLNYICESSKLLFCASMLEFKRDSKQAVPTKMTSLPNDP